MYLAVVDTAQIQPYVFGSNRLRENIGASHLVALATGAWALEAFRAAAPNHNVRADFTLDDGRRIEDPGAALDGEVLYAGGGNFVALFRDHGDEQKGARAFTRLLSRKVLADAPNLQLVVTGRDFAWGEALGPQVNATFARLAEEKESRPLSAPLLGVGVTRTCQSTGLPATGWTPRLGGDERSSYPASAEILAKRRATDTANDRLRQTFRAALGSSFDFPTEFDQLGRSFAEQSHLAVVHADGDGLGQKIRDLGKRHSQPGQNRDYVRAVRRFSGDIQTAATDALADTLTRLVLRVKDLDRGKAVVHENAHGQVLARIELKRGEDGTWRLPIRPTVFGGDDVTFVCDGRLGLALAVNYLAQFERQTTRLFGDGGRATACAGVAIVKAHYPFARAYALADELCRSAKKYRRQVQETDGRWDGSCLDWHFALSGLSGGIQEIRAREKRVFLQPERLRGPAADYQGDHLTLCPVALRDNPRDRFRAWDVVGRVVSAFQGDDWAGRRNKVKALRDALRGGPAAVERFRTLFDLPSLPPLLDGYVDFEHKGWSGGYCGYFDAVELADWFVPLKGEPAP